jgi:hypothetical protein
MNLRKTMTRFVTLLTVAVALTVVVACDQADNAVGCSGVEIPAHGCPLFDDANGNDVTCSDATCASAYSCTGGAWSFEHTCPNFDAGSPSTDASSDSAPDAASPGSPEASACIDLNLPPGASANGGTGCVDLELPDCPVGEVACSPQSCVAFGCDGLFYCQPGVGWQIWGGCADGGIAKGG